MNELISIIIPVYNNEKYISKCLESVIRQTYSNLDIIVIDDGSTDNSFSVCEEIAKHDKRIRILSQENKGTNYARERGVKESRGQFIGFVDSDDYIDREMFYYLHNLLKKNEAEIAICGHKIIENGEIAKLVNCESEVLIADKLNGLELIINDKYVNSFFCDKLFARKLFSNFTFLNLQYHEDLGCVFKLFFNADRIAVGNLPMYNYVRNFKSTSFSLTPTKLYHSFLAYLERFTFVSEKAVNLKEKTLADLTHAGIGALNTYIRENEYSNNLNEVGIIVNTFKKNKLSILLNQKVKFHCKLYLILIINCMGIYKKIVNLNILKKIKKGFD